MSVLRMLAGEIVWAEGSEMLWSFAGGATSLLHWAERATGVRAVGALAGRLGVSAMASGVRVDSATLDDCARDHLARLQDFALVAAERPGGDPVTTVGGWFAEESPRFLADIERGVAGA